MERKLHQLLLRRDRQETCQEGQPEYQYNLKVHLGNVRLTFTTKPESDTFSASFETNTQSTEQADFQNYTRNDWDLFDHTDAAGVYTYSQLLNGGNNSQVGLAKSLSVMPGDTIKAEVYAKYRNITNPESGNLTGFASALTAAFGLNASMSGDPGMAYDALDSYGSVIAGGFDHSEDVNAPKAYLNIILFDKNYNFVDAAYKQIGMNDIQTDPEIKSPHGYLSREIIIPQAGYAYIFLSNENPTQVDVYFDDVKITHAKSPVIQMDDYYPFGLTFNSYQRENSISQDYKYNGKEEQNELGLGWLDYGARMYQPELGRFFTPDRFSEKYFDYSPYQYGANNPIKYIDVNGDSLWIQVNSNNRALYQDGKLYNADGSAYSGKGVKKDGSLRGFLARTVGALNQVSGSSATGSGLVRDLQGSDNNFTIVKGSENGFTADNTARAAANLGELSSELSGLPKNGTGGTISFNPNQSLGGPDVNGNRNRPSFVGLAHELFHASDANFGILYPDKDFSNPLTGFHYSSTIDGLLKAEVSAVTQENQLRNEIGLPLRQHYGVNNGQPVGPRLVPFFLQYATYLYR